MCKVLVLVGLCLTLQIVYGLSAGNDTVIRIGGSISTIPVGFSARQLYGNQQKSGAQFSVDKINERGGVTIQGVTYTFELIYLEDEGNATLLEQNYQDLMDSGMIDFYLGPVTSDFTIRASAVVPNDKIMIGPTSGAAGFYQQDKRVGMVTAPNFQFEGAYPELRLTKEAKTIVLIKSDHPFKACDWVYEAAKEHGLEVIGSYDVELSLAGVTDSVRENITSTVKMMTENHETIDSLFICSFAPGGIQIVTTLKELNYNPGSIVVGTFTSEWDIVDPSIVNYVTGFSTWHENATFTGDIHGTTEEFKNEFNEEYGFFPGDGVTYGSVAVLLLATALEQAQTFDQDTVYLHILGIDMDTFIGNYRFSGDHAQRHSQVYVQWIDGERKIISPIQIKEIEFIYPFPKWDERELNPVFTQAETVMVLVVGIAIIICVAFLVFISMNLKKEAIRASSPLFLYIIGIGSILMVISVIFWFPYLESYFIVCHLRFWFLGIGFGITFGCLFVKTWRIAKLFDFSSLDVFAVTENHVIFFLALIMMVDVILLVLYSASGVAPTVVIVDPYRQSYNYYECVETDFGIVILYILGIYALILIVFGTIMAILIHNRVSDSRFNESKIIGFMIYNIFFFFVVIISMHLAGIQRDYLFIMRSACIVGAVLISVVSIWINRAMLLNKAASTSNTSRNTHTHSTGSMKTRKGSQTGASHTNAEAVRSNKEKLKAVRKKYARLYEEFQKHKAYFGDIPPSLHSTSSSSSDDPTG